jgi:hypothetical protein
MRRIVAFLVVPIVLLAVACSDTGGTGGSGSTSSGGDGGKTGLVSFQSQDGTRKCEAWQEGNSYEALCVSCAGPEMFLRAAERSAPVGVDAFCDDGEVEDQPGCYYVRCSADESLAPFIK